RLVATKGGIAAGPPEPAAVAVAPDGGPRCLWAAAARLVVAAAARTTAGAGGRCGAGHSPRSGPRPRTRLPPSLAVGPWAGWSAPAAHRPPAWGAGCPRCAAT